MLQATSDCYLMLQNVGTQYTAWYMLDYDVSWFLVVATLEGKRKYMQNKVIIWATVTKGST